MGGSGAQCVSGAVAPPLSLSLTRAPVCASPLPELGEVGQEAALWVRLGRALQGGEGKVMAERGTVHGGASARLTHSRVPEHRLPGFGSLALWFSRKAVLRKHRVLCTEVLGHVACESACAHRALEVVGPLLC